MKSISLPIQLLYPLLAAAPLVLGGCAGGVSWGEEAGGGGSQMANGAAAASGETVRTGSISGPLIEGTVSVIAEREATARQYQMAAERGRAWMERRAASAGPVRQRRYLAVDTLPDSRTSPLARKSVMIFDTEAQQVVGKNVYDVQSVPPEGTAGRFETYAAEYVGPGL